MCKIANQAFSGNNEKSQFVSMIHRRHNLHLSQGRKVRKGATASLSPRGRSQEFQWKVLLCIRHRSGEQRISRFITQNHLPVLIFGNS